MDAGQIPNDAVIATPSDGVPMNGCGLVFTGGACAVVTVKGNTVVIPAAFAGIVIPLNITFVLDTGTDATSVMVFR